MEAIKLRQGDSLNWLGREVNFKIKTEVDMTNWKATFQLCDLIQVYKDFQENKIISLNITKEESETLPVGYHTAYLKFTDESGRAGTQDLKILFLILQKEVENVTNL